MDLDNFCGKMAQYIEVIIAMEIDKEMDSFIIALIKVFVKDFGKVVFYMDKVNIFNQEVSLISVYGVKVKYVQSDDRYIFYFALSILFY
jgi:hypothetical protein